MAGLRKVSENSVVRVNDHRIDSLEAVMTENFRSIECPIKHYFSKGMYIREVYIPTGSLVTSKIHKTQHPFTLSKGKVKVSIDGNDWIELSAPFTGITEAGTRRIVMVLEDCVWTTYHQYNTIQGNENELSESDQDKIADKIEGRIIEKHYNSLIGRKELWHG